MSVTHFKNERTALGSGIFCVNISAKFTHSLKTNKEKSNEL